MLNQQQGINAFPNGSFGGMSSSLKGSPAAARNDDAVFSSFESKNKAKESGGFSLFGLFGKAKTKTLDELVPNSPWQNNQFFRDAVPDEPAESEAVGMLMDQFNMAYRTLI